MSLKPLVKGERVVLLDPPLPDPPLPDPPLPWEGGKVIQPPGWSGGVTAHMAVLEVMTANGIENVMVHGELCRRYRERKIPIRTDRMHRGEVISVARVRPQESETP